IERGCQSAGVGPAANRGRNAAAAIGASGRRIARRRRRRGRLPAVVGRLPRLRGGHPQACSRGLAAPRTPVAERTRAAGGAHQRVRRETGKQVRIRPQKVPWRQALFQEVEGGPPAVQTGGGQLGVPEPACAGAAKEPAQEGQRVHGRATSGRKQVGVANPFRRPWRARQRNKTAPAGGGEATEKKSKSKQKKKSTTREQRKKQKY